MSFCMPVGGLEMPILHLWLHGYYSCRAFYQLPHKDIQEALQKERIQSKWENGKEMSFSKFICVSATKIKQLGWRVTCRLQYCKRFCTWLSLSTCVPQLKLIQLLTCINYLQCQGPSFSDMLLQSMDNFNLFLYRSMKTTKWTYTSKFVAEQTLMQIPLLQQCIYFLLAIAAGLPCRFWDLCILQEEFKREVPIKSIGHINCIIIKGSESGQT